MSERIVSNQENISSDETWDIVRDHESLTRKYYEQAVSEIEAEYADKTGFEKKVMFELVLNDENKARYMDEKRYIDPWGISLSKERIKHDILYDFDFGMNCGGFALEMFVCLFPGSDSIEDATKNILQLFPFVRKYEGGDLSGEEYLVLFRYAEGGKGHHFVKLDDGVALEKDGCGPVKEFSGWADSLEDAPEVAFAVNRLHTIVPYDDEGKRVYSYLI